MDLELGNILFNTNKTQEYRCPDWVVALLRELSYELELKVGINSSDFENPFSNTGHNFKNDTFEVQAYNWNDDVEQPYNFKCGEIEISWYKYLGRDTTINKEYDPDVIVKMFNKCMKSLNKQ